MAKVIDGTDHVLGRLASKTAELAMNGEKVEIVNSEKVLVTGRKESILNRYKEKYDRGDKDHGPHFPRRPDRILKRTVRGMLPFRKTRGNKAYKKVKTYLDIPAKFEGKDFERFEEIEAGDKNCVTLEEISKYLGSRF